MSRKAKSVAVLTAEPAWRKHPGLTAALKRAARRALEAPSRKSGAVTILLADDERLRALNAQFRGKDKATNVLSFESLPNDQDHLGDVAIAYGVAAGEAEAAGKPFADHATHLVVHGVLHLLGYDHESAREARIMEPLETSILAELDIADPYAAAGRAA